MCTFSTSERQKRFKALSFWHVWLGNVLLATMACTFSTSERQKVVRARRPVFFTFDLEICFAPQRRALFRRRNLQKWSDVGVFCTVWLGNVLCATTTCTFSTSQLPKAVRTWGVFSFLLANLLRATTARLPYLSRTCLFFLLTLSLPSSSHCFSSPLWLFPPLLFHLSILSEVWLLNFLRP